MDAMLQNDAAARLAADLGKLLDEHRGGNVMVMDMRSLNFWTDFFIIATVTSNTHLTGLERHIKDFAREKGLEILRRSQKPVRDRGQRSMEQYSTEPGSTELGSTEFGSTELGSDEWCLLDLGGMVIHLMTARTRSFFELERLWSAAPLIFGGTAKHHSSKSS